MTDYLIRAYLRAATKEKILTGWQGPHYNGTFSLAPSDAGAYVCSREHAVHFCELLKSAKVKPLFRDSEPLSVEDEVRLEEERNADEMERAELRGIVPPDF